MINATFHLITNIDKSDIIPELSCLKDKESIYAYNSDTMTIMQGLGLSNVINWSNVLGILSILHIYPEWESKISKDYKEKTYIPGLFPISYKTEDNVINLIDPMDISEVYKALEGTSDLYDKSVAISKSKLLYKYNLDDAYTEATTEAEKIAIAMVAVALENLEARKPPENVFFC